MVGEFRILVSNSLEYRLLLDYLYSCGFKWKMKEPYYDVLSKIYGGRFFVRFESCYIDVTLYNEHTKCTDSKHIIRKHLKI